MKSTYLAIVGEQLCQKYDTKIMTVLLLVLGNYDSTVYQVEIQHTVGHRGPYLLQTSTLKT